MTTWKELEAQGVKRCCAMFTSGKQCRRRASEAFEASWCEKHGPVMKAHTAHHLEVVEGMSKQEER